MNKLFYNLGSTNGVGEEVEDTDTGAQTGVHPCNGVQGVVNPASAEVQAAVHPAGVQTVVHPAITGVHPGIEAQDDNIEEESNQATTTTEDNNSSAVVTTL